MRAAEEPLDPVALFARWAGEGTIALAVSGGADSLALMALAARWRAAVPTAPRLVVLSVDHGLRPEAAAEVAAVGALAAAWGFAFRALKAQGPAPVADIEAEARAMRYRLLAEAARAEGAGIVMTAHHADDQAETLMLRLARGSGIYGLSAMAGESEPFGIRVARPLLALRRAELALLVRRLGLEPVEDPHNADARYARARMRALMPRLAAEGLGTPTLVATARRFRRAAAAIDDYADRLFARALTVDVTGAARLSEDAFRDEPEETRLRALGRILRAVGGAAYSPRLDSLGVLCAAMSGSESVAPREPLKRTLAGVVVDRRKGTFRFQREAGRGGLPDVPVEGRFEGIFDGRFRVAVEAPRGDDLRLAALGPAGRRALAACLPGGLPLAIEASPALFRRDVLVAAPLLGLAPDPGTGILAEMEAIVAARLLDRTRDDDL